MDQYAGETLEGKSTRDSVNPLPVGALHDFLTSVWGLHGILEANFEGDIEGMLGFFVAESACYPDLGALCRQGVPEAFPEREGDD